MHPARHPSRALLLGSALLLAACGATGLEPPTASPAAQASTTAAPSALPADVETPVPSPAASADTTCTAPATPTLAQTEGPYYKAGAPESSDLTTPGMAGTRLTLVGLVVDTACVPIAGARIELWQADAAGVYDNAGYTLRGYVTTDAAGRFAVLTVVPGEYPGRTEHIHVKVTPAGGSTLTTQLYFPGTTANDGDGIYDPSLLLAITDDGGALTGTYTFVLAS